ncbi:MAG TPA: S8/S53 family peptidase [Acidimicrobiales bacterium]|nr:S8/S53 family peptidase [Acidimicrobiales bacterium]
MRRLSSLIAVVLVTAAGLAGVGGAARPARAAGAPAAMAVVALVDSGINPYNVAFRDRSALASQHPSTYLPGYPKDAVALPITLDVPFAEARKRDAKLWADIEPWQLYWVPGTRIVGMLTAGAGGTGCPVIPVPPASVLAGDCPETPILDDHGHGTMTASRAAGTRSLAPTARIVEIEGLGAQSLMWAADAGFIDVISNSWGSPAFLPPSASDISIAFAYSATRALTIAASGNGTGFILGAAPNPTYASNTAPPGVVLVGGHDNGKATLWSGSPPHVVADAYGGWAAINTSSTEIRPDPISCCTSAAAPYAAGGATAIVQDARRLLGHRGVGVHDGVVARGRPGQLKGPLADGVFTLDELRHVLLHSAEARPGEGRDDGLLHWAGDPRPPEPLPWGLGSNPFCAVCTTTPLAWNAVPDGDQLYPFLGYGAVNERSLALALNILRGIRATPSRPGADQLYATDQQLRSVVFSGTEE